RSLAARADLFLNFVLVNLRTNHKDLRFQIFDLGFLNQNLTSASFRAMKKRNCKSIQKIANRKLKIDNVLPANCQSIGYDRSATGRVAPARTDICSIFDYT